MKGIKMKNAIDFIRFALSHAKRETVPVGAQLPLDIEECGTEPWEYLFGTTGLKVTDEILNRKYKEYYRFKGWSRESYDLVTENWAARQVIATDCQGMLSVYLGMDVNPNFCYMCWCTKKGLISSIERPFVLGEAVFFRNNENRMCHIGFICGFLDGEPLVVEARGLRFGVCVTKLSERPWSHRGLIAKQLIYDENCYDEQIRLSVQKPMIQGDAVLHLQKALNSLGYYCGNADGKCGNLTMNGIREFVEAHCCA